MNRFYAILLTLLLAVPSTGQRLPDIYGISRPVVTVAPSLSGNTERGSTLTITPGTYTGSISVSYQWLANGVVIGGETGLTYVTTPQTEGDVITAREISLNAVGTLTTTCTGYVIVTDSGGSGDLILSATLERFDGGSGSLDISSGVIFAEGDVTEADVDDGLIRVFVDDVEQAVYTEALDGRWPDGTVKSVLIQFANDFTGSVDAEIRVGTARGTSDISKQAIQPDPDGMLYLDSPEYLCDAFPLWYHIIPKSEQPTGTGFGASLDTVHSRYQTYSDSIWNASETWSTGEMSTLTTRTDNTSGVLGDFQGIIYTGNTIDLYWNSGANSRLGVTVGTVSGGLAPFSGGTGDSLPAQGTTTIYAVGSGPKFFAIYGGGQAAYDYGRNAYTYFCMTGDSTYLYRCVKHGFHVYDGYGGNNNYALPEWYSHIHVTMLMHYWLTGNEDSRTASAQSITGSTYNPAAWAVADGNGFYPYGGRILSRHVFALVIAEHLGQDPISGTYLNNYATNPLKARAFIDAWCDSQETDGSRLIDQHVNADFTLSGISGTFQQFEYLRVNGGGLYQNYLSTISGGTYIIGRNSGGALAQVGNTILGQTSGATATVATIGSLRAGSQPWMAMLADSSFIAYSRWISSDRDTEIKACLEKDFDWEDNFWNTSGGPGWYIYDTEANWHVVPTTASPDLNTFTLSVLDFLIENETDPDTLTHYLDRGDASVGGSGANGFWSGRKQFNELNWGMWQYIYRRAQ